MNLNKSSESKTALTGRTKQQTLRTTKPIVKKHSGCLEEILAEINGSEKLNLDVDNKSPLYNLENKTKNDVRESPTASIRRRLNLKDKEKKRERWLLTRKTWRYMTDAGRKLIPDGVKNRQEDISLIEANFQKVCSLEPNFVLWKRKYSYPGALRNSKKRLKQLLQHTGQKSRQAVEREEIENADVVLDLLHNYLNLNETIKTDTLLGCKTIGPHQTNSPSAQRPQPLKRVVSKRDTVNISLRGPGFLPSPAADNLSQQSVKDQLLQRLFILSRNTTLCDTINLSPDLINVELLNDKTTLKNIYNALKKQQLHRIIGKHSRPLKLSTNLTHSLSALSLLHADGGQVRTATNNDAVDFFLNKMPYAINDNAAIKPPVNSLNFNVTKLQQTISPSVNNVTSERQKKCPPTTLNISNYSNKKLMMTNLMMMLPDKQFNSCGTQTNFIPLSEIKRLAVEYKECKKELNSDGTGNATTDDEGEKQPITSPTNRRKSSIDNEDVSQSVSDTIKRYLRMARKKSAPDVHTNRFKRVNYDQNLRNIQAKGEINPPGMDENNNKAIQTLDAWALIALDFIHGNITSGLLEMAHNDWQKCLDERLRRKYEYEQKINQRTLNSVQPSTSSCSSTPPTSPVSDQASPTITNILITTTNSNSSLKSNYDPKLLMEQLNVECNPVTVTASSSSSPVSGILNTGSQFIANFWPATSMPSNLSSPTSLTPSTAKHAAELVVSLSSNDPTDTVNRADMKKSKSLSHIGHSVSAKLLKGHSKNQNKLSDSSLPTNPSIVFGYAKWSRTSKCIWKSETGECIILCDTALNTLSELEIKMVKETCMERIIELDIGINLNDLTEGKSTKKHPLTKMRAMTTSFFDIGKKESGNQNLSIFGNSLEACIIRDKKCEMAKLMTFSDGGSRNSIASLFRTGSRRGRKLQNSSNKDKLSKQNVSSCDNLLTESNTRLDNSKTANRKAGYSLEKKRISRSQSDVRRYSLDNSEDDNLIQGNNTDVRIVQELKVPKFVSCCLHFLEENGLHKVGIFRVGTSRKKIKEFRNSFDKDNEWSFDDDTCPHNVATLLKEFLRDLPEPLLTNHLYEAFIKTQKVRNRRLQLEALSHLVKLLPPAHLDTLYVLLKFLAKLAACSDDVRDNNGNLQLAGNKMDSYNLATVFAPNILRTTTNKKSSSFSGDHHIQSSIEQKSIDDAINVIRIMIDHYEELFLVPADILDTVLTHLIHTAPEQLNAICEYHKTAGQNLIQF